MKLVSLIIPAFNEVARIHATVGEALDYFDGRGIACEVIVSADGTDGTREAARALAERRPEIQVIGQPERRGKGRGIREAVRLATDDVIGSRAMRGSRIERAQPIYRRLGSWGFGLFMHVSVGLRGIVDTQCGFKFFQGDVAR